MYSPQFSTCDSTEGHRSVVGSERSGTGGRDRLPQVFGKYCQAIYISGLTLISTKAQSGISLNML